MSELDRRLLLAGAGLAGVAALGRLAKAGPLDPPPGPVSPTGKTLTQVYDKIARTDAGLAEPRIPVSSLPFDQDGNGYVIAAPGSYYLTESTPDGSGRSITITASGVDLDLNGFQVHSSGGTCIRVTAGFVRIRNGRMSHTSTGGACVDITGGNVTIENIQFSAKIVAVGSTGDPSTRCVIRNCTITGGGDSVGIAVGDFATVLDCTFRTTGDAISVGKHAYVSRCSVSSSGTLSGVCISVGDYSLVESCCAVSDARSLQCVVAGANCQVVGCSITQLVEFSGSAALRVGEGSSVSFCSVRSGREGVVLGNGSMCCGTSISGGRYGALMAGDRCVIEDCVIRAVPLAITVFPAVMLGGNCVMRRNTVTEVPDKVAISAVGNHNRIEENTVSSCGTGIETIGTGNLVARNHCTLNTNDYSLAPGTKAGPIVSSPADPNGSHPWANFAT